MPVRLKNPNAGWPSEGFLFSDPHTAMLFNDPASDLNHQALLVAEHRRGNPRIYNPLEPIHFDIAAIKQEVVTQVCARYPEICEDSDHPGRAYPYIAPPEPAPVFRQAGKVCPRCQSQDFEVQYCKTCGGGKINGYKCLSCGLVS